MMPMAYSVESFHVYLTACIRMGGTCVFDGRMPVGEARTIDGPGQPWSAVWDSDGGRLLTDLSPTPLVDQRYLYRRLD